MSMEKVRESLELVVLRLETTCRIDPYVKETLLHLTKAVGDLASEAVALRTEAEQILKRADLALEKATKLERDLGG